jgi:hypothetical protein
MNQVLQASQLNESADHFSQLASKLKEAANILAGVPDLIVGRIKRHRQGKLQEKTEKRVNMICAFLKKNGPSTRKQVIDNAGLSQTLVDYLLKDRHGFKRDAEHKWTVIKPE